MIILLDLFSGIPEKRILWENGKSHFQGDAANATSKGPKSDFFFSDDISEQNKLAIILTF